MRSFAPCADAQGTDITADITTDITRDEISDRALELAAGLVRDGTANLTIAFCSGLDECSHPGPRRGRRD